VKKVERGVKRTIARANRRAPTVAEARLWTLVLRANQLGFHFRRETPVGGFIVDFCCWRERVIVEIDGGVHESRVVADKQRTAVLEGLGYYVVRFTNEEITSNLWSVRDAIRRVCLQRSGRTK
jgi:very-short-patch-repair endonuclease